MAERDKMTSDLVIRILNEADIAGRPGQYDRLNQISKDVEQAIKERAIGAWDDCASEAYFRGWLHDLAHEEMLARNPLRDSRAGGEQ